MDTCLILPAAGRSSRMHLPYPKELLPLAENTLLIDSSLLAAAKAGIEVAYIVTNNDKLRLLSQMLGPSRHGIRLVYVLNENDLPDCDAGSVIRGCRRANLADSYTKFLVAFPDCWMPRLEMQVMLADMGDKAVLRTEDERVMLAHFDTSVLQKLRRRLLSLPKSDTAGQFVFNRIMNDEISAAPTAWKTSPVAHSLIDVNTFEDYKKVLV